MNKREVDKTSTQQIFDRIATELLGEGKTTLTNFCSFATAIYKFDPFLAAHHRARLFLWEELKLRPIHLYSDIRKHIVIDLQEISYLSPAQWPERLKALAQEYKLNYKGDYYSASK